MGGKLRKSFCFLLKNCWNSVVATCASSTVVFFCFCFCFFFENCFIRNMNMISKHVFDGNAWPSRCRILGGGFFCCEKSVVLV